jgi:amino acid transporter
MGSGRNKFGAFKGVFTPSILTILGVIMYLRLPWIVGEAGLIGTIGIILVAHLISVSTGLSVASIATDKRVETGGTYFMISRSLGLPIGGTLGLALFVGLSFSVSLYLIGFSETFLTAMGIETTINNIRITGALTLLVVTILTFISTSLALKTQFVILAVMVLSLVSIFLGRHEFSPAEPLIETASSAVPWIVLFAVFFPAVTGFEAGVSMSGDLRDPKKSIPKGTILAIIVGLVVYIALAFFFSHTVSRDMLRDPSVLYQISLYSPLVVAGIWGATLSSALGSILGAPRILQATAIDRISPKFFAKGFGAGNEPRNALFLTFAIAFAGIMIGDLNAIARIVTIFFIITYGFLNLTCAIENVAGSDFRPSFRVPALVGFLGAFACFVVMIQLDVLAMLAAIVVLGMLFLLLKRKELTLQSGDTWGGIWSYMVKTGLFRLSSKAHTDKRNWRPNIILFSGNPSTRPHLINMARTMVGKLGVFTNFELIEQKSDKYLFLKAGEAITTIDSDGKKVFTRRHVCKNIFEGINTISNVYGFTGFEPNTILLGWGKTTKEPQEFTTLIEHLHQLDYNLAFLNYESEKGFGRKQQIDLWWETGSNNLNFGITLLKFISSDPLWRRARLRVIVVSNDSSISEKAQTVIRQVLDDHRMDGDIKIIENSIEKKTLAEIIKAHRHDTDLSMLDFEFGGKKAEIKTFNNLNEILDAAGTSLIIQAGSLFDPIILKANTGQTTGEGIIPADEEAQPLAEQLHYPSKEILANELYSIAIDFEELLNQGTLKPIKEISAALKNSIVSLSELNNWVITSIEKILKEKEFITRSKNLKKLYSDYLFQADRLLSTCEKELLPDLRDHFDKATNTFLRDAAKRLERIPEKVSVKYNWSEFETKENDTILTRIGKLYKRSIARLFKRKVTRKTPLRRLMNLFLITKRQEINYLLFQKIGLTSLSFLSSMRRNLNESNEIIQKNIKLSDDLVSANLALKEGKEKLLEINSQMQNEVSSSIVAIGADIKKELQFSLVKISDMLGDPATDRTIAIFEKTFSKKVYDISDIADIHSVLEKNLLLYLNKIHTEFRLHSLKARLKAKLSKQAEDLNIMLENKIIDPLSKIKEMAVEVDYGKTGLKSKSILDELKGQEPFDLRGNFERFFKDIQTIIKELPDKIEVIQPEFIADFEKGEFAEQAGELIELQKQTNLYIGRDMTNNIRIELNKTEDSLNTIQKSINDILRLAVFNLENITNKNSSDGASDQHDLKKTLFEELMTRIDTEQKKARDTYTQAFVNLNALLDKSFEPLSSQILARPGGKAAVAENKKGRIRQVVATILLNIKHKLQNQWVKFIYTRSEGLLLVKRMSKIEKDHKFSNQAVYEILETLLPNAEIKKKIPFYYANLFAGNSTINKDLWVGMHKELRAAQAAVQRFRNGYGGALLITGERNAGKSSISRYIARDFSQGENTFLIRTPKEGSAKISDLHLAIQESVGSTLGLNYLLEVQPESQVFVFDDLELWWERTAEGSAVLEEILRLIARFGKKHLFIINCRNWSYDFLNRFYKLEKYFFAHIECQPFDARELKEMVIFRHRAGGLKFRLSKKEEDAFSEYDYAQLFNRYFMLSDGNPGDTIRAWISNITNISGKTIDIRLPQIPDTNNLSDLSHDTFMIVLQFVLHRRFTVKKLAAVLRQTEQQAFDIMADMHRAGLVEEKFTGVYALNPMLEPFLVEQLKQRKLL